MPLEDGYRIIQQWSVEVILLSYIVSVTGSYCTIMVMEQWRLTGGRRRRLMLLCLASIALGGCGIWSMHFTGMNALHLQVDNGKTLEMHFEGNLTILSLILPIFGVFFGLLVVSKDPLFLEIEAKQRRAIVQEKLQHVKMTSFVQRRLGRKIKVRDSLSLESSFRHARTKDSCRDDTTGGHCRCVCSRRRFHRHSSVLDSLSRAHLLATD